MPPTGSDFDCDVAIIGGGPVGLGLAIELAQRGVVCRVVERATSPHRIPKGQNLTQRSGEHFRAWGVSAEVRAASPIPHDFGNAGVVTYGSLLGEYSYDWFKRGAVNRYYFAENERLPQYELERVLRARAAALPEITLREGLAATGAVQDAKGVTVTCECAESGEVSSLRARFAVGCDGARSVIREAAGLAQEVDARDRRMALLVFRSTGLDDLLARYPGKSIYLNLRPELDGYWQFLGRVDLDGGWFYHAPVPPDAKAGTFDFRAHLHSAVGAEFDIEFEHIGFWDLRIAYARSYRNRRIFIAGDAAHSHPPYGGYGVNTGLEDARNLGWKLAAALDGWAGEGLLASYSKERQPVFASTARDFIARMIRDDSAFCRAYAPERDRAAFEAAWAERATGGNKDVTQFLPNYAGSGIVAGAPGAASSATGVHAFRARAGHHLGPCDLPSGADLFASLGAGFTLLNFSDDPGLADGFVQSAKELNAPLDVMFEPSPAARALYEASLILVRPDHFIAWAGDDAAGGEDELLRRAIGDAAGGTPERGKGQTT